VVADRGVARSCESCLGWVLLHHSWVCAGCKGWQPKHRERSTCPRCRHDGYLNTDGLCRPCLHAVRAEDEAEWALGTEEAQPRALQLTIGMYRDGATSARPYAGDRAVGAM